MYSRIFSGIPGLSMKLSPEIAKVPLRGVGWGKIVPTRETWI